MKVEPCIKEGEGVNCVPDGRCRDCEKCPIEIKGDMETDEQKKDGLPRSAHDDEEEEKNVVSG